VLEGELVEGFESSGLAALPCGVPPGGGAFLGASGGAAFSMTRNAGGRGPSEATVPPGAGTFSCTLKASGVVDDDLEPGSWDAALPRAEGVTALGGRRTTVAAGGVDVEDLLLNVAVGRLVVARGGATLGG
jgi:hypothetical protein